MRTRIVHTQSHACRLTWWVIFVLPLLTCCLLYGASAYADAPFSYYRRIPDPNPIPSHGTNFGHGALILSGDKLLIGGSALAADGIHTYGQIYFYQHLAGEWVLQQTLTQSLSHQDRVFGRYSDWVLLSNDGLYIDDDLADLGEQTPGYVYQFRLDTGSEQWIPNGGIASGFGGSIVTANDQLFVGAISQSVNGIEQAGAVYIYDRDMATGQWQQDQQLVAGDAENLGNFGGKLTVQENTLIVGAPLYVEGSRDAVGRVYVFQRDETSGEWQETQEIANPNDHSLDAFGQSVELIGNLLLVGSDGATIHGNFAQGAVYVYQRDPASGQYTLFQTLLASDGKMGDFFGSRMVYCAPYLLVSANFATPPDRGINFSGAGRVYVLSQDDTQHWQEVEEILDPAAWSEFDAFGTSLSCSGNEVMIGAIGGATSEDTQLPGTVYDFVPGGDLTLQQQSELPQQTAGNTLTYDFVITNNATTPATNVVLTDKMVNAPPPDTPVYPASGSVNHTPMNTTSSGNTSLSADPNLFQAVSFVSGTGVCVAANGDYTCQLGDLAPGGKLNVSITVRFASDAAGKPVNIGIVSSDQENAVTTQTRATASVLIYVPSPIYTPPSKVPPVSAGANGGSGGEDLLVLLGLSLLTFVRARGKSVPK